MLHWLLGLTDVISFKIKKKLLICYFFYKKHDTTVIK